MIRTIKTGLAFAFAGLAGLFLLQASAHAQDKMKPDTMKQDNMKHEKTQDEKMMHEDMAKTLFTGKFHGKVHETSGRATVYQEADGKLVLRRPNFKTPNGPADHGIREPPKAATV